MKTLREFNRLAKIVSKDKPFIFKMNNEWRYAFSSDVTHIFLQKTIDFVNRKNNENIHSKTV